MRPHRFARDLELVDDAEIDAALEAALNAPLDELLAIEEFAEKLDSPPTTSEPHVIELGDERDSFDPDDGERSVILAFPVVEPGGHERAA